MYLLELFARGPWVNLVHKNPKNQTSFGHLPFRVSPSGRGAGQRAEQLTGSGTKVQLKWCALGSITQFLLEMFSVAQLRFMWFM